MRAHAATAAIFLTVLGLVACDRATPTAPPNTKLVITASPLTITQTGTSTVTITALRSSGQPVNPGTEIRLDTTLGTIEPIVTTDERGQAVATLRGGGVGGEATVTARSGAAESVNVKVQVGAKVDKVTLVATPASIPAGEAAQVELVAVVRDIQGQPIQGANVIFTTEAGRLASEGTIVVTNERGEARDRLNAGIDAVDGAGDSITVTAQAASGGASVTATTNIVVRP
jgi:hypothetical protein